MKADTDEGEAPPMDIDQVIRRLKDELEDIVVLNADIQVENQKKDQLLEVKEGQLKKLRDIFQSDAEQLEMDYEHYKDDLGFKVKVEEERISCLNFKKQRLLILEEENSQLQQNIFKVDKRLQTEGLQHAEIIHNLNKSMQTLRSEMEVTLRMKLTEMDRTFQHKAYGALSDHKKEALLKNARLKDESTLQDSGMTNLENRLTSQQEASETIVRDLYELESQEDRARENIGDLLVATNKSNHMIRSFRRKERKLMRIREAIKTELNNAPKITEINEKIVQAHQMIANQTNLIKLWEMRLELLREVEAFIQPMSDNERTGFYSVIHFPLSPIIAPTEDYFTSPPMTDGHSAYSQGLSFRSNFTPTPGGLTPGAFTPNGVFTPSGVNTPGLGPGGLLGSGGNGVGTGVASSSGPLGFLGVDPGSMIPNLNALVSGSNSRADTPHRSSLKLMSFTKERQRLGSMDNAVTSEKCKPDGDGSEKYIKTEDISASRSGKSNNLTSSTPRNINTPRTPRNGNTPRNNYNNNNNNNKYKNEEYTIKLSQLRDLISADRSLFTALLPIKGREHVLLKKAKAVTVDEGDIGEGVEFSQNMVTWTTLEILRVWRQSEALLAFNSTQTPGGMTPGGPVDWGKSGDFAELSRENLTGRAQGFTPGFRGQKPGSSGVNFGVNSDDNIEPFNGNVNINNGNENNNQTNYMNNNLGNSNDNNNNNQNINQSKDGPTVNFSGELNDDRKTQGSTVDHFLSWDSDEDKEDSLVSKERYADTEDSKESEDEDVWSHFDAMQRAGVEVGLEGISNLPEWLHKAANCADSLDDSLDVYRKAKVVYGNGDELRTGMLAQKNDLKPFVLVDTNNNYTLRPPIKTCSKVLSDQTPIFPEIRKAQREESDDQYDRGDTCSVSTPGTEDPGSGPPSRQVSVGRSTGRRTLHTPHGYTGGHTPHGGHTSHMGQTGYTQGAHTGNLQSIRVDPITLNVAALRAVLKSNSLAHSLIEIKAHTARNINSPITPTYGKASTAPLSVYRKPRPPKSNSDLKIRSYLDDLTFSRNQCDSMHYFSKPFSKGPLTK